jgi:hypothetical protein
MKVLKQRISMFWKAIRLELSGFKDYYCSCCDN